MRESPRWPYTEVPRTAPAAATDGSARSLRIVVWTSPSVASVSNGNVPLGERRIWYPLAVSSSAKDFSMPPLSITMSSSRAARSEEHTSELQSQSNLVCRLLLEKKKKQDHPRS